MAEVCEVLLARPEKQNVIVTGRDPIPELLEIADTISEVREIRHAFQPRRQGTEGDRILTRSRYPFLGPDLSPSPGWRLIRVPQAEPSMFPGVTPGLL